MLTLSRQLGNDSIGELLPPFTLVRPCLMGAHGERGVEEQHALFCPLYQTARSWNGDSLVAGYFLKDVAQRWGMGNTLGNRETQTFGLTRFMIGILAQQYDFDFLKRAEVESSEYVFPWRITGGRLVFLAHEIGECLEVGR